MHQTNQPWWLSPSLPEHLAKKPLFLAICSPRNLRRLRSSLKEPGSESPILGELCLPGAMDSGLRVRCLHQESLSGRLLLLETLPLHARPPIRMINLADLLGISSTGLLPLTVILDALEGDNISVHHFLALI